MKGDVRHLIAGYATGTLSEAERRELFEAALHDPELFAAIANEEPLRELLLSPIARADLLERVEPAAPAFRERFAAWLRQRSVIAGAGAFGVVAVIASVAVIRESYMRPIERPPLPEGRISAVVAPPAAELSVPEAKSARKMQALDTPATLGKVAPAAGVVGGVIGAAQVAMSAPPPPPPAAPAPASALDAARALKRSSETVRIAEATRPENMPGHEQAQSSKLFLVREKETPPPSAMAAAAPPPALPVAKAAAPPEPNTTRPVQYEIEARDASGVYAPVATGTALNPGDMVRVRFQPAMTGVLTVREESISEPLITRIVRAGVPATTEPILMDRDRRLQVTFTATRADEVAASVAVQSDPASRTAGGAMGVAATRLARGAGRPAESPVADAGGRVVFSIELRRKP